MTRHVSTHPVGFNVSREHMGKGVSKGGGVSKGVSKGALVRGVSKGQTLSRSYQQFDECKGVIPFLSHSEAPSGRS